MIWRKRVIRKGRVFKNSGGTLTNYGDFKVENTRKGRTEINSNNYIPMPRTMAIPKENI